MVLAEPFSRFHEIGWQRLCDRGSGAALSYTIVPSLDSEPATVALSAEAAIAASSYPPGGERLDTKLKESVGDFFELDVVSQEGVKTPAPGDAYMTVRVSSAGFSGHNDIWVSHDSLRGFCSSLVLLERDRRGRAELSSMSPNELTVTVRSIDSRGHMAVEGSTGYGVRREGTMAWHAVHFGFEFEPSQLAAAASVPWVEKNADGNGRKL